MSAALPILVINCGSSSLKFSILDPEIETALAAGIAEGLKTGGADLKMVDLDGGKHSEPIPGADHRAALLRIIELLGGCENCKSKRSEIVSFTAERIFAIPFSSPKAW